MPSGSRVHLDFGCGGGRFLASLRSRGVGKLVGVDASAEAIESARQGHERSIVPGAAAAEFLHVRDSGKLPFADGAFSSVSLLDVLEHLADQRAVLRELYRVCEAGGVLIVTVPRRHVFSFLDMGNMKFRFPRLHKWWYCRKHSLEEYRRRYEANTDGLVGDVSAAKGWHEHFSPNVLASLLMECGFEPVVFAGSGLFHRPLRVIGLVLERLGPLRRLFAHLYAWDARRFESMNLFCLARKRQKQTL